MICSVRIHKAMHLKQWCENTQNSASRGTAGWPSERLPPPMIFNEYLCMTDAITSSDPSGEIEKIPSQDINTVSSRDENHAAEAAGRSS